MKTTVTILVSGTVRRAAAAVNGTAIQCRGESGGALKGSEEVDVSSGELKVGLVVYGAPGTSFVTKFSVGSGRSIEKKSRMKTDVAIRPYTIKLTELT